MARHRNVNLPAEERFFFSISYRLRSRDFRQKLCQSWHELHKRNYISTYIELTREWKKTNGEFAIQRRESISPLLSVKSKNGE